MYPKQGVALVDRDVDLADTDLMDGSGVDVDVVAGLKAIIATGK